MELDATYVRAMSGEVAPFEVRQAEVVGGFLKYCRDFWPEYLRDLGGGT
jgi:hypothetical protein